MRSVKTRMAPELPMHNQRTREDLKSRAINKKKKKAYSFKVGNTGRELLKDGNRGFAKSPREASDREKTELLGVELSRIQETPTSAISIITSMIERDPCKLL